jgi:hypothetical protein
MSVLTYRINEDMKKYLNSIHKTNESVKKENEIIFNKDVLFEYNSRVKSENYYGVDDYGLIIRKNDFNNSKSPFGWIKEKDPVEKIVNIHCKKNIAIDNSRIRDQTIAYLKCKFSSLFKQEKGILNRYYSAIKN